MSSQRGGARPKVRLDDGRARNRPSVHLGRLPTKISLKVGDVINVKIGADVVEWTVIEILREGIEFRDAEGQIHQIRVIGVGDA